MNIIKELKENQEDFEYYPTTQEIIEKLYQYKKENFIDLKDTLDIGSGKGDFFQKIESIHQRYKKNKYDNIFYNKYAIEKSMILIEKLPNDIFVLGTDFLKNSLIDKKIDTIFSNPPYSEYEIWVEKILKESNAKNIFILIPERWKENKKINNIIEKREIKYKIIGNFNFEDSEDRKARAKVDLIHFSYKYDYKKQPFDIWFDQEFQIKTNSKTEWSINQEKKENLSMIKKENIIKELVSFYEEDMKNLYESYKLIQKIDSKILKELNVNIDSVKESLKNKIEGLKNLYWEQLINRLDKITDRLTQKSRDEILNTIIKNSNVDFNEENILSIVIWILKNANKKLDDQIKEFFRELSLPENIKNYKSNKKIYKADWRYEKHEMEKYILDYRLIKEFYSSFKISWDGRNKGLNNNVLNFLKDCITIGKNLGFNISNKIENEIFEPSKKVYFSFLDSDLKQINFMEVKVFKNGNCHFKFNQKFIKKLNIEAGRLFGWIKKPSDIVEETDDITIKEANDYFKSNFKLQTNNLKSIGF